MNDTAQCIPFWEDLCHFLQMKTLIRSDETVYCIGSRTGIVVRGAPSHKRPRAFDQETAGLHHLCFRARSRDDVDAVHTFIAGHPGACVVHAPEEGGWAPGYYSVLFEDPDGLRVEVNFVPGQGHFGEEGRLGPYGEGPADDYDEHGFHGKATK